MNSAGNRLIAKFVLEALQVPASIKVDSAKQ